MAGTISTDLSFFTGAVGDSSCDPATTTDWAGYAWTRDVDVMVEGAACLSFKLNSTVVSTPILFTMTGPVDLSSKTLYFWTMGLRLAQWDTKANGGIRARFEDGTNYCEWHTNGKDTMPGGWVPNAARPADTVDAAIESYGATPTLVDQTSAANSNTADDVYVMCTAGQGTPQTGDCYYVGKTMPFKRVIWRVSTALVGTSTVSYEYWNGTAWTALSGVTDRTTNFTVAGVNRVEYTLPTDWVPCTINSQGPFYYVRAVWTIGSYTTRPLCARAWVRFSKDPEKSNTVAGGGDTDNYKECDWGQVTKIGFRVKLLIGVNRINIWFDAFRYGSYLQCTAGGIGTEGSFSDFMTDATNGENAKSWGVLQKSDGVYVLQGQLLLGSSGTATTNFKDVDAHIRIKNNDSIGENVMGIDFLSNSTGASVIQFGDLTVSGGKNLTSGGLLIDTDGPKYVFNVTQTKSTDTSFVFGTKFKGCSRFRVGTTATTASYWKIINNKFEACNTIQINDGGNSTWDQNSVAGALTVPSLNAMELYAVTSTCTWTDNAFINCNGSGQRAITFMASGTYTLKRQNTANNTFDYYMGHASGTVTLNLIDSTDNPTLGPTASSSISYDVYEKTTWDLNVQNALAGDIDDAGVRLTDTGGIEQVLVRTDINGDIVQQQVKRRTSEHSSGLPKGPPTVTVHNPYNLRVRKYEYLPMEIDGKTFGTTAVVDGFVMADDAYAVDAETTVEAWTNIDIDRSWTPTRTTLTNAEYGTLAFDGNTITRTSGDWTDTSPETDNYSVKGTNVTITGSTSNDGTYHAVSATALVLTVLETLVPEGASTSETVTGWRPYQIGIGSASPNRSINDVYEFMRWLTSQTTTPGNYMNIADPIVTADGTTYVVEWYNFDVDTITLTGAGKTLSMPEKDFTLTNGGAHGLYKVQDIDGSSVSLTVVCKDELALAVPYARVRIEKTSDNSLISDGEADATGVYSDAYTYLGADVGVNVIARLKGYLPYSGVSTITSNGMSVPANMPTDEAVDLP